MSYRTPESEAKRVSDAVSRIVSEEVEGCSGFDEINCSVFLCSSGDRCEAHIFTDDEPIGRISSISLKIKAFSNVCKI